MTKDIFDFVIEQEAGFSKPISLVDGWNWNWKTHIRRSLLYKNSQFEEANDDRKDRPFKNIVRPILNVQYRTEGFDVKDIELYVNDAQNYHKSFLTKKFHEDWALENEMDTFIDELVESYVDYGGALVKNVDDVRPEVVNLQTIAFCDQTNFLSGPFAIKHYFSPSELRNMGKQGWGEKSKGATFDLETLIKLSEPRKTQEKQNEPSTTPGKYIEVYEVHGSFPANWLSYENYTEGKYESQIHIVAFYKNQADEQTGVCLFKVKEPKLPFKFLKRDPIFGRALGFGGVEELFDSQVWTNSSEIYIMEMLNLASKTLYKTTDPAFKNRNKITDLDNGEILSVLEGRDIGQLETTPRNLPVFVDAVNRWEEHASRMGASSEALMGQAPTAGTPFKLFEAQIIEDKGLHRYRQGKIAVFVDGIYRDWILPYITREITKGKSFLSELSSDELQMIADKVSMNEANRQAVEKILNGELIFPEEMDMVKEKTRMEFLQGGSKRFIEIFKDEMKDIPLKVKTNIAGKQKNLALLTDKVVNVLRQFIATPEIRQDPEMVKLLNTILESSGLSPMIFGASRPSQQQQQGQGSTEPLKALAQGAKAPQLNAQ